MQLQEIKERFPDPKSKACYLKAEPSTWGIRYYRIFGYASETVLVQRLFVKDDGHVYLKPICHLCPGSVLALLDHMPPASEIKLARVGK